MSVDTSGLEAELRAFAVDRCQMLADRFAEVVQSRMPRRTGELAGSVFIEDASGSGNGASARVTVEAEYARYVEEGTGVYGPDGSRIEGNPLLAFDWPAAGGLVIVHSVAGMPGVHYWEQAIADWPSIVSSA